MHLVGKVAVISLLALGSTTALAHGARIGAITIAHPYALATPRGATTGGAYFKELVNEGTDPDALIGVTSPVADVVEIHTMRMDGDVMRMRAVPSIGLGPGLHVAMQPGGSVHLMFIGLKKPWVAGDRIPATLRFGRAGPVDVSFTVEERNARAADPPHRMPMP